MVDAVDLSSYVLLILVPSWFFYWLSLLWWCKVHVCMVHSKIWNIFSKIWNNWSYMTSVRRWKSRLRRRSCRLLKNCVIQHQVRLDILAFALKNKHITCFTQIPAASTWYCIIRWRSVVIGGRRFSITSSSFISSSQFLRFVVPVSCSTTNRRTTRRGNNGRGGEEEAAEEEEGEVILTCSWTPLSPFGYQQCLFHAAFISDIRALVLHFLLSLHALSL